ncbi:MAG TPA: RNA polymerase sigma factor [Gammaproteobacteria bacterium]|nr:RNA polymerase sigma factor [Gammaproteobacteria bacterium]
MASSFATDLDEAIVTRARRGDRQAHAVIYRAFGGAVYTLARRLLRHPEAAEEALQETFVEVLTAIRDFRGEAPLGAWIRRIAVNKCLMQLRSYWHRHREEWDENGMQENLPLQRDEAAMRLDMETALAMLPSVARTVVWLHDVEGYTHEEIARLLGRTPSFSKSQLARAYAKLRAVLAEEVNGSCMRISMSS